MTRRSLTSNPGDVDPASLPARRQGGTRHSASDRVLFTVAGKPIEGWALNKSRGGLRAIVDEVIELGTEAAVAIGDGASRPCRIVWIQEEPDGAIVGVQFLDVSASVPDFQAMKDGIDDPESSHG